VAQTGIWHGVPLGTVAAVKQRVQSFEITHGLNMLGLSLLQNLSGSANGVYVGGGLVIYVPHSENRVDGLAGGDVYHFVGFGFQTQAGAQGCTGNHTLFAEAKYNYGRLTGIPIAQGTASTTLDTVQELGGLDFGPCNR
jgi:hypothetical protein